MHLQLKVCVVSMLDGESTSLGKVTSLCLFFCKRDPAFEFPPRGAFILLAALDFCCEYVRLQIHIALEGGFTLNSLPAKLFP